MPLSQEKKKKKEKKRKRKKINRKRQNKKRNILFFLTFFSKKKKPKKKKRIRRKKTTKSKNFLLSRLVKIDYEKATQRIAVTALLLLFFLIIFINYQTVAISLTIETNEHIAKMMKINQKIKQQGTYLENDLNLLQDHTLTLNERKKIMQDLRAMNEISAEVYHEVSSFENDLSVNLWIQKNNFNSIIKAYNNARILKINANNLTQDLRYLVFLGHVNSFQLKLTEKDLILLKEKSSLVEENLFFINCKMFNLNL